MARIAIVGAGITGLTLALQLREHAQVVVFEKARGVGGRISTRYAEPYYFDHGAQFFTARSDAFKAFLSPLIAQSIVREWKPKLVGLRPGEAPYDRFWFEPHYVACPHMNALCKYLAQGMDVQLGKEIAPLTRHADGWELYTTQGDSLGVFDYVISTAPPVQTKRLFGEHIPAHAPLPHAVMKGCYALMIGLTEPWKYHWHAATVEASPINWMALNNSKPGRELHATSLVVHASQDWSEAHIDADATDVTQALHAALTTLIGPLPEPHYSALHRWRYALVTGDEACGPYHLPALGLGAIGDWTVAGRIEAAWQQAAAFSSRVLHSLATGTA